MQIINKEILPWGKIEFGAFLKRKTYIFIIYNVSFVLVIHQLLQV